MKKLRGRKGFTLVELLCVLAVLVLVSAGMLTGVLLGVRSYAKSVSYSEAQVLLQTLKTSVSDELRYAGVVRQEAGRPIGFFSQRFGQTAFSGFSQNQDGQVLLGENKLLPAKAYPYGLRAQAELTAYDPDTRNFAVYLCVQDAAGKRLCEAEFEVHQLNQPPSLADESG